jgi:hypothetical protein
MSILDVTEDQIFQTLGKGKDPNFKPIEKVRPVVIKPKKTYTFSQPVKAAKPGISARVEVEVKPVESQQAQQAQPVPSIDADESMNKLTVELTELNNQVRGIKEMVKWYIVPQFIVILALIFILFIK